MSKKNENAIPEMETAVEMKHILDVIRDVNGGEEVSLKAFALALEIPATRLYAIAKRPIIGQVYDPNAKNWDAINEFLSNKVTAADATITSLEELVTAAVEKEKWMAENTTARVATGSNLIDVDGGKMPKRKAAMFEMGSEQESLICFKHDAGVYKMVYQTLGYTAIRQVNEDGTFAKEEIRVVSNSTLNTKCVPPTSMAQAIADRFSGAYTEQTATESENVSQTADEAMPVDAE
jgi:hypothetical protein